MIDTEANITDRGGEFAGMDRFEAREAVRSRLREIGAIETIEEHPHSVGHCSRCGTVVEPLLSLQWFVAMEPLAKPAIDAIRSGDARFIPQRWENNYFHWMENIQDWCISRQLWWGHRIPAWYCEDCDETIVALEDPTSCPSCGRATRSNRTRTCSTRGSRRASGPFSTLGWPEQTADLATFYPTTTLVTGFEHHLLLGRPDDGAGTLRNGAVSVLGHRDPWHGA